MKNQSVAESKLRNMDTILLCYNTVQSVQKEQFMNWMGEKDAEITDILLPASFSDPENIRTSLGILQLAKDSVYSYLLESVTISSQYGILIKAFLNNPKDEELFIDAWKNYEYTILFNFKSYADYYSSVSDLYEFMQENYALYDVIGDSINFKDQTRMNTYKTLMGEISNAQVDLVLAQNETASAEFYEDAVSFVKKHLD
jgi:hypothetical protein